MVFELNDPTNSNEQSSGSQKSLTTVSGRFVAVLPNEGLPQTLLHVSYFEIAEDKYSIEVNMVDSTGEKLKNRLVEFNFDEATSNILNEEAIKNNKIKRIPPPVFSSQELLTNEDGYAETEVEINRNVKKYGLTLVIRINSGIISKSISI
jgi:hypothetical protein